MSGNQSNRQQAARQVLESNKPYAPASPYTPTVGEMPFSQEAEEAVIGSVLVNPGCFVELLKFLNPEDFFLTRHILIWEAMIRLRQQDLAIDYLTVIEELGITRLKNNRTALEEVGGDIYIIGLFRSIPTSVHAETYGRLVERAAIRRRLLAAADEIRMLALKEDEPIDNVIGQSERKLIEVSQSRKDARSATIQEVSGRVWDDIEMQVTPRIIYTGLQDVDRITQGMIEAELWLFGGRPGMGKTAVLCGAAIHAARRGCLKDGKIVPAKVLFCTMEMPADQIICRIAAAETGANSQSLMRRAPSPQDARLYAQWMGNQEGLTLVVDDTPNLTVEALEVKAAAMISRGGLDLIVIDYVQLMGGVTNGDPQKQSDVGRIEGITQGLKKLAKRHNIVILAAVSLSRTLESRADKRPILSDIRYAGESDGDGVMFLYRDEVYNEATEFPNQAEFIIAKHRNGSTGFCHAYFDRTAPRFMNAAVRQIDLSEL